jgi:cystathionine beta-lyase/cystathionine gamma-synthase
METLARMSKLTGLQPSGGERTIMQGSILDHVGRTPLVPLHRLNLGLRPAIYLKAVDSTFASPYLQQPLSLGADIVVHSTASRQMRAFGGMISLRLRGGAEAAHHLLTHTRLFSLAESLGGVESLICHPASMTHASIPPEVRIARGVDDGLVRLSVGIEDESDLRDDLQQALLSLPS